MSSDITPIIIVKKVRKKKKDHHGGSWKIAYADFVTAMMAFFMLMWLLSLLNKYQLQGVSAYFQKPLSDIFVGSKNSDHYKVKTDEKIDKSTKASSASSKVAQTHKELNYAAKVDLSAQKMKAAAVNTAIKAQAEAHEKKDDSLSTSKAHEHSKDSLKELQNIKRNLQISLETNPSLKEYKDNISFEIVDDGVKVSLHDSAKHPMFSLGKADFHNYAKHIINWLCDQFNTIPKQIVIIGHTDANQYDDQAAYTNWELSTDRANAVRRLLIAGGMKANKIIRIEGAADVSLEDVNHAESPVNRRVEVIILKDEAAKRIAAQ